MREKVDLLDLLRGARRSAADRRKVFLTLYGLLFFVLAALAATAVARAILVGSLGGQLGAVFLRPVRETGALFSLAFQHGAWPLLAGYLLCLWLLAVLCGSFFGLAITRMAAVELTCGRRAEVKEAIAFARGHWYWDFLTRSSLLFAALFLLGVAAGLVSFGRLASVVLIVAAPCAFVLAVAAVFLLLGLFAGGILAAPAIATEWSDAFDAITRVYGYSFTRAYRLVLYRTGAFLALCLAVATRAVRVGLVFFAFFLVLVAGLGWGGARHLLDAVLLEAPQSLPLPTTLAAWAILASAAVFLTAQVARLLVFLLVLRQAVYLLLRLRVDKVPLDSIDGYRPDDSAYDAAAQGFELVEVEEEL